MKKIALILILISTNFTLFAGVPNNTDTCQNLICYVKNKMLIPNKVIKNKTIIDSVYLNETGYSPRDTIHLSFEGDTIYNINANYSAVIVNYNDGLVCIYKFILIVNLKTNVNTDYLIGASDCDRDGDNEYYNNEFLIQDKKITIFTKFAAKGVEIIDSKIIERNHYVINDFGKFKKVQ